MRLDKDILFGIVEGNGRFIDPFEVPEPYFILDAHGIDEDHDAKIITLYYERLRYAVDHADLLIEGVFDDRFYDLYGVDRDLIGSPAQMCSELYFDPFSLDIEDYSVCAYLSNRQFMFGHFIEVMWDSGWEVKSVWIN